MPSACALATAALLVDQDRQFATPGKRTQAVGQRLHLGAIAAIALEQDIAERIGITEKVAFLGGEFEPGDAEDDGFHVAWLAIAKIRLP
jgi:hypothetical protein